MHDGMYYLDWILDFFRAGFAQVNATLGLLIALYSAWRLSDWRQLWAMSLGAVLIHIIAMVLVPMIDHNAPLRLPALLDVSFWKFVVALYLGYVVIIAALFFVKTNVLKGAGGGAHAAHH
ncbi:MAG: hypothetical protein JSR81_01810 [Proteobacteria bacterium]|nr:hypothetical protein [Pseudomonadota bacterium]